MLKQTITFTDFNGTQRTQDLYFNLTEFELVDIQVDSEKGIQADLQEAIDSKDLRKLLDFIKMLVHKAYGIKSEDGLYFEKSDEITARFVSSALYSDLLLHLFEDEGARATTFITGLMPKELLARAIAQSQGKSVLPEGIKPDARMLAEQRRREQRIPEATQEGGFQSAPPIGSSPTQVTFQAPAPAAPTQSSQPDPTQESARIEYPVIPGGYTETSSAPEDRPFRVKETPTEPFAGHEESKLNSGVASDDEHAEFLAWKASQEHKKQN